MEEHKPRNVLICGKPKSGKTTRAFQIASEILLNNPNSFCLVLTNCAKFIRKTPNIPNKSELADRFLFKCISNKSELVHAASERHLFTDKQLSCIIVDDMYNFIIDQINPTSTISAIALLWNSALIYENCSLIITTIMKNNDYIKSFRIIMDEYESMQDGKPEIHKFHKSLKKMNADFFEGT
ncbi:hypothetical protein TVAG_275440 [Trichomonas vaginalis G3]|uniref:ATPase AAA-type core domain-containing protein n=1 Tax=Trichomonas vaginalis (strain ATCC PRA-98 / G3) TaxID=412133 RepID=A2FAP8_TRIV3|nr:P-loop containing nucleoside triphosphate hydrolases family [Trichomonas vaginalis G3]EAX98034.1 hypothetical protein TVAG_275440 [Trichomonas vaginalis G3]KAI5528578.1 P-loop containing nucleoside triphosphate hydrolases family [Trichomonas vaginalis G3]|eukprot:XP_001310964.1 hypothetical protein [Trichomonas vaginalis G3]